MKTRILLVVSVALLVRTDRMKAEPPAKLDAELAPPASLLIPKAKATDVQGVSPPAFVDPKAQFAKPIQPKVVRAADRIPAEAPAGRVVPAAHFAAPSVAMQPPIEILQTIPESVQLGEPVNVTIVVTNKGSYSVQQVLVTDDVGPEVELISSEPACVRKKDMLTWDLGKIEAGRKVAIKAVLKVRADAQCAQFTSSARLVVVSSVRGTTKVVSPKIEVSVGGPGSWMTNAPVRIPVVIRNTGNTPAQDVIVSCALPKGAKGGKDGKIERLVGTLKPGQTESIVLTFTPTEAGNIEPVVTVSTHGLPPVERTFAMTIESLKLELVAEGPKTRSVHRPSTIQFTVTNKGTAEVKSARLASTVPPGASFAHASEAGEHDAAERMVYWKVENLKPGETKTVALNVISDEVGQQVCQAVVTVGSLKEQAALVTNVKSDGAIAVEPKHFVEPLKTGGEAICEFRVSNNSDKPVSNVKVVIKVPSHFEAVAADGPVSQEMVGDTLTFEPLAKIDPKGAETFRVKVKALKPGDHLVPVSVTCDGDKDPTVEELKAKVVE